MSTESTPPFRLPAPARLFRIVAIAEAITWAGLLFGMFLKYGPADNATGVRIFGMVHGVVFIAYVLTTIAVWIDQRWSIGRGLLAVAASIPPLATLLLEWWVVRKQWIGDAWRLPEGAGTGIADRSLAALLRNPVFAGGFALLAVAALTGLALLVGPPASS